MLIGIIRTSGCPQPPRRCQQRHQRPVSCLLHRPRADKYTDCFARAPRARRELWQLWFVSRDEWLYLGQPDIDFEGELTWLAYDRERHCHLNEDGSVYTG